MLPSISKSLLENNLILENNTILNINIITLNFHFIHFSGMKNKITIPKT